MANCQAMAMERRWGFLRSWCAPLCGKVSVEREVQSHVPIERCGGVLVRLYSHNFDRDCVSRLAGVRHALVILTLAFHADRSAWQHALVEFCALDTTNELEMLESEDFRPRFVLQVEESQCYEGPPWFAVVMEHLTSIVSNPEEERFLDVVGRLAAMTKCDDAVPPKIEVPLVLRPTFFQDFKPPVNGVDANARAIGKAISSIYKAHGGYEVPAIASLKQRELLLPNCTFVLAPLEIDAFETEAITSASIEVLEGVTDSNGPAISQISANVCISSDDIVSDEETTERAAKLLQCLLLKPHASNHDLMDDVVLSCLRPSEREALQLCSAVATATSTKRVSLHIGSERMEIEQRQGLWEMLAYSLFSKHKSSTVSALGLFVLAVSNEDVDAFSSVLEAENPTEHVFGIDADLSGYIGSDSYDAHDEIAVQYKSHCIQKGSTLHLPSSDLEANAFEITVQGDINNVIILRDNKDSDDIVVLVPSYGVCTTRREFLVNTLTDPLPAPTIQREITSLDLALGFDPADCEGLPRLLEIIGQPLTYLLISITRFSDYLSLDSILKSCPNLNTLIIQNIKISSAEFIRVYHENDLRIREIMCNFDDIALLATALGDLNTSLSRRVRSWSFSFRDRALPVQDQAVAAIASMLESNAALEYLDLMVPESKYREITTALKQFHNQPVQRMLKPFSQACRLAFISVMHRKSGSRLQSDSKKAKNDMQWEDGHGLPLLASPVLQIIFDFAAPCARRKVYVRHFRR